MSKNRKLVTMKLWAQSRKTLNMISAFVGKPMTEIVDALATKELERVLNDDEGNES